MSGPTGERRRFQRITSDKPVALRLDSRRFSGVLRDISLHGLLFEMNASLPAELAIGKRLLAEIDLGGDHCMISIDGTVAHIEGTLIGVRCEAMELESAARLRRLVELNLAEPEQLQREFAELIQA